MNAEDMKKCFEKMALTKYSIDSLTINTPAGAIKLENKNIKNMGIIKDFDENFLPILLIDIVLSDTDYYKYSDGIGQNTVTLSVSRYIQDKNDTEHKNQFKTKILNGVFKVMNDDISPSTDMNFIRKDKEKKQEDIYHTDDSREIQLVLFNNSHLERYRKPINKVIGGCCIKEAIMFCLNQAGIDKVLFQKPDNNKVFSQLLLPINNMYGMIMYLDAMYGIYNYGLTFFQDYECLYLHDKSPCKVWRPQELKAVTVNIASSMTNNEMAVGTLIDQSKSLILVNIVSRINIINKNISNKEKLGNSYLIMNDRDNSIKTLNSKMKVKGSPSMKFLYNRNNNPYIEKSLVYESDSRVVEIEINDMVYDVLTPNKIFRIQFEEGGLQSKYGGNYRMTNIVYDFQKNQTENYSCNTTIQLRKI